MKSRATAWLAARKMGSTECLAKPSLETPILSRRPDSKTHFELTSLKIKQLLEKKKFQKVVEFLRELPHDVILKCLESFPFKALNRAVPESFPVWETLLMKLHNSEDGYIPQFPYAACDELVLQISRLLESCEESPGDPDLPYSCKRVLKKVYMQYNEVLERLYKEQDRIDHALYSLGLHLPLGTDYTAISLQQAIVEEVQASLVDYHDALERLQELSQDEAFSLTEAVLESQRDTVLNGDYPSPDRPFALNPNQLQLQERLYFNQCVLTTMKPSRRMGNLVELLEIMNERIKGDKEVLAVFGSIRQRNDVITDAEPVEPWLRKHQHAVECAIATLKDIEKELEITIPKAESPAELREGLHMIASAAPDDSPQIIPVMQPQSSEEDCSLAINQRHSAAILDDYLWEEEVMDEEDGGKTLERKLSLPMQIQRSIRPRSVSPQKIIRTSNHVGCSNKSFSSTGESSPNLTNGANSASFHDLQPSKETQLAFTRVQSLKTPRSVVAGKKKSPFINLPNSLNNLSTSSGSVNTKSKSSFKKMFRSGSGDLGPWKRQGGMDILSANQFMLQQELEYKTKELLQAREVNQELRRRERELTDRLSEQAQRQLQDSEKFEDILLGTSRPTMVVQRYQELYSQGRVEALESIENLCGLSGDGTFASQLVLDVMKMSYRAAWSSLEQLGNQWKGVLGISEDTDQVAVKQLESAVGVYLRRVCSTHDLSSIVKGVFSQLAQRYSNTPMLPEIQKLQAFRSYVGECARLSWDLCIQSPAMVIHYSETEFNCELHSHFYTADKTSTHIVLYLWPALLQSSSGPILFRGVVLT